MSLVHGGTPVFQHASPETAIKERHASRSNHRRQFVAKFDVSVAVAVAAAAEKMKLLAALLFVAVAVTAALASDGYYGGYRDGYGYAPYGGYGAYGYGGYAPYGGYGYGYGLGYDGYGYGSYGYPYGRYH